VKILITAFGPFAGRPENASSLALRALKRRNPSIHMRILPVDSVIAPARLRQAVRQLQPDVLLMLGEAAGDQAIRLERLAWNELDFRIPDIAGRQPRAKRIEKDGPVSFESTLPLQDMERALKAGDHGVVISEDPGRFLCNQVFYEAMGILRGLPKSCPAGFIHLPLADDYPTERAVDALTRIIGFFR
jgi:pyroglutamyl-peptidase